jgi:hypothetical protein
MRPWLSSQAEPAVAWSSHSTMLKHLYHKSVQSARAKNCTETRATVKNLGPWTLLLIFSAAQQASQIVKPARVSEDHLFDFARPDTKLEQLVIQNLSRNDSATASSRCGGTWTDFHLIYFRQKDVLVEYDALSIDTNHGRFRKQVKFESVRALRRRES